MRLRRLVRLALFAALASAVQAGLQSARARVVTSRTAPRSVDTWPPVPRRPS